MIKQSLWMGTVGLWLLAAAPTWAAEGAHRQGTWEVTLTSDFDEGFSPSIGYYLVDNLVLSVLATYAQNEVDVSGITTDVTETAFGAGLEFNIPTAGPVVPVVGVSFLYVSQEEDLPGVIDDLELSGPTIQVEGGLKFAVNERSSVNLLVFYTTGTLESTVAGAAGPDADVTDVSVGLGYSIYFP